MVCLCFYITFTQCVCSWVQIFSMYKDAVTLDHACMCVQLLSCVQLFVTPWIAACQAPLSMEFSSQEYCSGLPFPSPGDLPDPGIKSSPLASPALAGGLFTTSITWETLWKCWSLNCVWLFVTPWTVTHQTPLSMEFSRQEYGVGCHSLLQGIFQTQGSNPGLLHCRQILYHLRHQGRLSNVKIFKSLFGHS